MEKLVNPGPKIRSKIPMKKIQNARLNGGFEFSHKGNRAIPRLLLARISSRTGVPNHLADVQRLNPAINSHDARDDILKLPFPLLQLAIPRTAGRVSRKLVRQLGPHTTQGTTPETSRRSAIRTISFKTACQDDPS